MGIPLVGNSRAPAIQHPQYFPRLLSTCLIPARLTGSLTASGKPCSSFPALTHTDTPPHLDSLPLPHLYGMGHPPRPPFFPNISSRLPLQVQSLFFLNKYMCSFFSQGYHKPPRAGTTGYYSLSGDNVVKSDGSQTPCESESPGGLVKIDFWTLTPYPQVSD